MSDHLFGAFQIAVALSMLLRCWNHQTCSKLPLHQDFSAVEFARVFGIDVSFLSDQEMSTVARMVVSLAVVLPKRLAGLEGNLEVALDSMQMLNVLTVLSCYKVVDDLLERVDSENLKRRHWEN
mmetsp:Transcript_5556/g.11678  ORF Transcript_5556/g.11678 Transcript_5556/m.11678 type:complete len:124 (+) Transcript_5556:748-1119(+)